MEDSLIQRALLIFDNHVGKVLPDIEDETLLCHLLSCFYLCLKMEDRERIRGLSFEKFTEECIKLTAYKTLEWHLTRDFE